jgi:RNA polymerase sigma-70 factor (ECF subfamily)
MTSSSDLRRCTDRELVRLARRDAAAFAALYERHAPAIRAWLKREVRDPQAALDLTAETFARALEGLHRFRGRHESSVAAWLYAIARNLAARWMRTRISERDACRRLGVEVAHATESPDSISRSASAPELDSGCLQAAYSALAPSEREVLDLRVVHELAYAEVGGRLGCSVNAARIRTFRALQSLREHLLEGEA